MTGFAFGFLAAAASLFLYYFYLPSYVEEWLGKQRVYQILFEDFSNDKARFVAEYVPIVVLGEEAIFKKHEEMKVIMMVNHIRYYMENASSDVLHRHAMFYTWFLSEIYRKNPSLCDRYLANSALFAEVWKEVGDKMFLDSIKGYPEIIVSSVDTPEAFTREDRARARTVAMNNHDKLTRNLPKNITVEESKKIPMTCEQQYHKYYALSTMPSKDAALVMKLLYSEEHPKKSKQNKSRISIQGDWNLAKSLARLYLYWKLH